MRRAIALAFLAYTLSAADPDPEFSPDAVSVDGMPLLPLGRLEAGQAAVRLHPKALIGAGYDSNPLGSPEPQGDGFVRAMAGIEVRADSGDGLVGDLDAMLTAREHARVDADQVGGRIKVAASQAGPQSIMGVDAFWSRSDDPIQPEPGGVLVEDRGASAGFSWEERWWEASIGLAVTDRNYLEDGPDFAQDDRDLVLWQLTAAWARLGAEASRLGLEMGAERGSRGASRTQHGWTGAKAAGRWRHVLAERSAFDLRLGLVARRYEDTTLGDPGNDDETVILPLLDALLTTSWQERSRATIALSIGPGDPVAADANASERALVQAWLRVRLADRVEWVNYAAASLSRDTGVVLPEGVAEQRYVELETGMEYRLRHGLGLRPSVSWRRNDTTPGELTSRIIASATLVAAF